MKVDLATIKQNAEELGAALERTLKRHTYRGVEHGHIDMFAVFAALTEVLRRCAEQIPYEPRRQLCQTAIDMLTKTRDNKSEHFVKLS